MVLWWFHLSFFCSLFLATVFLLFCYKKRLQDIWMQFHRVAKCCSSEDTAFESPAFFSLLFWVLQRIWHNYRSGCFLNWAPQIWISSEHNGYLVKTARFCQAGLLIILIASPGGFLPILSILPIRGSSRLTLINIGLTNKQAKVLLTDLKSGKHTLNKCVRF